jgi:hypothetical protein
VSGSEHGETGIVDFAIGLSAVLVFVLDLIAPPGFGLPFSYCALLWFVPSSANRLTRYVFQTGTLFAAATILAGMVKPFDALDIIVFNRFLALLYIGGSTHMIRDQLRGRAKIDARLAALEAGLREREPD